MIVKDFPLEDLSEVLLRAKPLYGIPRDTQQAAYDEAMDLLKLLNALAHPDFAWWVMDR